VRPHRCRVVGAQSDGAAQEDSRRSWGRRRPGVGGAARKCVRRLEQTSAVCSSSTCLLMECVKVEQMLMPARHSVQMLLCFLVFLACAGLNERKFWHWS
jgi:hypothetical protein